MTMKTEQNSEIYDEIVNSGKSLLQLYIELAEENDKLRQIVCTAISAHSKPLPRAD